MAPRETFGLILRTIGLIALATSALYIYSTLFVILYPSSATESALLPYLISAIVTLAIGLYFLKGAPHVLTFAYGSKHSAYDETEIIDSGSAIVNDLRICSFCGKSHTEVKKLIQGPGVWICDNCVTVCKNALEKDFTQNKPAENPPAEPPSVR